MRIIDNFFELFFKIFFPNPEKGLPLQIFRFSSYIVPMINIELLISDEQNRVALTWRKKTKDVPFSGWHIPGGIIRVNETIDSRIKKTALNELGITGIENWKILGISETRIPIKMPRRHFISILIHTKINSSELSYESRTNFKSKIPGKLIANHERYEETINKLFKGQENEEFIYFREDLNFAKLFLR